MAHLLLVAPALAAATLAELHHARELLLGRGLAVLAAWALLNLIAGGSALARSDRRQPGYFFYGMCVGWGLVNACLAFWVIWQWHPRPPIGLRLADIVQAQLANENLFLLNTGLDVAYVMTGFYLRALAAVPDQPRPERLLGFGQALWIQGGFLLVFDAVMWSLLHWQGSRWLALLP